MFTAVLHVCGRSKRQRQVERNRRYAICIWQEGKAGISGLLCINIHDYSLLELQSIGFCCIHLQLRLNKVSELIHNSTNHKNLAMARVCVHFEDITDTVCFNERSV